MSSPPSDAGPSPSLMPYPNTFSEEEIHDILGAMNSQEYHEDANDPITADCRAKARSERKRSREKQRREDVNKHFGDLSQLLRHIESEDEEGSKWIPVTTVGPTNRVDLIARTIVVLERIHKVSTERKQEIVDLNKQLEDMKKIAEDTAARLKEATMFQQGPQKSQVMMMVPMMVNPESMGGATSVAAGFMTPQQQMPFMPQQMMMMPQMPQMSAAQAPAQQQTNNAPAQATMPTLQLMQQMMQPMMQQQMMQQQMPYATMMFAPQQASSAPVVPAVSSQPDDAQQQQQQQQQQGKQQSQQSGASSGGNLAHCA